MTIIDQGGLLFISLVHAGEVDTMVHAGEVDTIINLGDVNNTINSDNLLGLSWVLQHELLHLLRLLDS